MILKTTLLFLLASASLHAIEEPEHKVLKKDDKFELRQYPDLSIVTTPMSGMRDDSGSFMRLFGYISGGNEGKQKIEMTAPVFMQGDGKDRSDPTSGKMSFMIPADIAKEGSPKPTGENVALEKLSSGKFAVLRFFGHRDEAKRLAAAQSLQEWVKSSGWKSEGEPFFAFYDPPMTPEKMRRNEVWVRVSEK